MKTKKFKDGSELKIGETPQDRDQLNKEFPTPYWANKVHELHEELAKLDPDIRVELVVIPEDSADGKKIEITTTLYCRDFSFSPPRLTQWRLKDEHKHDDFVTTAAAKLVAYWQRRRATARG